MDNKKYYIIAIAVIVAAIIVAGALILSNSNDDSTDSILSAVGGEPGTYIKVHSDKNVSGKIEVYEFRDIKENNNGTYNLSQFGDYYGLLGFYGSHNGATQDIMIENGEANYKISNGTQFIFVYPYITDVTEEDVNITVELVVNGQVKFTSIEKSYSDQDDISWGNQLISIAGEILQESKLIPDTSHNKFINQESDSDL